MDNLLGTIVIGLIIWAAIEIFEGIGEVLDWISGKLKTPMLVSVTILILGTVVSAKILALIIAL